VVGISAMAGIGFTVSLFITGLAFDAPVLQDEAKIGILVASAVAALLGSAILYGAKPAGAQPAGPGSNEPPVATPVDSVSVDRDL
jgi:NhaA family Na+:H+ antiporter